MQVETFVNMLNVDFYTGVPDSLLKPLCNYLMDAYGIDSKHHMIAANEGNCTAIAAGYHLATGKVPALPSVQKRKELLYSGFQPLFPRSKEHRPRQ